MSKNRFFSPGIAMIVVTMTVACVTVNSDKPESDRLTDPFDYRSCPVPPLPTPPPENMTSPPPWIDMYLFHEHEMGPNIEGLEFVPQNSNYKIGIGHEDILSTNEYVMCSGQKYRLWVFDALRDSDPNDPVRRSARLPFLQAVEENRIRTVKVFQTLSRVSGGDPDHESYESLGLGFQSVMSDEAKFFLRKDRLSELITITRTDDDCQPLDAGDSD